MGNKFSKKEREEYRQLISQLPDTPPGKKSRELHRKLKELGCGGLEFKRRYPNFDLHLALAAFLITLLGLIIRLVN